LQNQREVVCNDRAGKYAERKHKNARERVGSAPGEIHACGVKDQVRVKRVLPVQHGSSEVPQKPGVLKIVAWKSKQARIERKRSGQGKEESQRETYQEGDRVALGRMTTLASTFSACLSK
jgi:hypothetical protein